MLLLGERPSKRIRKRRQTRQWKNVFDAAQNGDLEAVQRYIEDQHIDVNSSLPGNTGNLLSAAAQKGYTEIVRYLISRGADVNAKDRYGYNSLLWVLDKNKTGLDIIQLLVENGADVNVQAKENGYTPLHWAVIHNRFDTVQYLVGKNAYLNSKTNEGLTPVQEASKRRFTDIVSYLTSSQNVSSISGDIFEAAVRGDVNAVRYFVETVRQDPFVADPNGETALHKAASAGKLPVVKYLLEIKSRNVNIPNANGESALISATIRGHFNVIQYLLEDRHANPDAIDKAGYTPLLVAARSGNLEVVRYLIDQGNVNVKATELEFSNDVLHVAAQFGHSNVVIFLVDEKKFNIYSKNKYGDTALHVAARYGKMPVVKYFIDDKGMDFNLTNIRGRNVLHAAVEGGSLEVVRYLLDEKHADITAKDNNQNIALHIAVESDQLQMVKYLIEVKGLDATTPNSSGLNALKVAETYSRQQILSYFVYERGMTLADPTMKPNDSNKLSIVNPLTISVPGGNNNYVQRPSYYPVNSGALPMEKPVPIRKPAPGNKFTKPVKLSDQFIQAGQLNLQTTEEYITEGSTVTVKQHYLINGKEVDKATMDKAIMDYMKASAAFTSSSDGNRVTWGQQTVTDANGTHTKYIVNGQEVDVDYYANIIRQYGSGNPNGVSSTFSSSSSSQMNSPQYYSAGRRRKRSIFTPKSKGDLLLTSASQKNIVPSIASEGRINNVHKSDTDRNISSDLDNSNVNNFLILFNLTLWHVTGNRIQRKPKHESLLSPNELIENRIDRDAINAVSGLYNF